MSLARPLVNRNDVINDVIYPGDVLAGGENILSGQNTTVGNSTWTGAQIATGIIYRTGPTGAYADATDTAANIIAALSGTAWTPDTVPGISFRLLVVNTVAFIDTVTAGTGVVAGTGVLNIAASTWREYLITILNSTPPQQYQMTGNNGTANIYFGYSVGTAGAVPPIPLVIPFTGSNGVQSQFGAQSIFITPGASATGTNIPAATTVIGIINGQGGAIGVTLSANLSGAVNGAVSFGPSIKIDGLRSGTL